MNADQLTALLRRPSNDPAIEAAFLALRTRRRPTLDPEDRDAFLDWILVRRQGIELGFADEVYFRGEGKSKRRRKNVPLLLHQVYLYTARDDISDFRGNLMF